VQTCVGSIPTDRTIIKKLRPDQKDLAGVFFILF